MRIIFTLLLTFVLLPLYGLAEEEIPVYNASDVATLRKIAQDNSEFINRNDWLSDNPEWIGVTWGGVSSNSKVTILDLSCSRISTLDVRALDELTNLDCSSLNCGLEVSILNVDGLQNLQKLNCNYNSITELILSDLPELEILDCEFNDLQNLDVSLLPKLKKIDCEFNELTKIIIAESSSLEILYCSKNKLTFSALFPLKGISTFHYSSQFNVFTSEKVVGIVDYSSEAEIDGVSSQYVWYKNDGDLLDVSDFDIIEPGKFTFNLAGDFYCEIKNTNVPDLTLKTNTISVAPGQRNARELAALRKIAEDNPDFIYSEDWLSNSPKWEGILWGGDLNDARVIKMTLDRSKLANLDLRPFAELRIFKANSWATQPQISSLNITGLSKLKELNYSSNTINDIDFTGVASLEKLDCSNNDLKQLDLSELPKLRYLNCGANFLTRIDISNLPDLVDLICYSNELSFKALFPLKDIERIDYQNQKPIFNEVETTGIVDYSSEVDVNGTSTNFKWFYSNGKELEDYNVEINASGVFTFKIAGEFYCEMTNALFPNKVLKSKTVSVKGASKNTDDILSLKAIAEVNLEFIYRNDWLSENPEWEGVIWGGSLNDTRVIKLTLIESHIEELDVSSLSSLVELDCSSNHGSSSHISTLVIDSLQNFEKLTCKNNRLKILSLSDLPELNYLDLYSNSLKVLDLENLSNLETLKCRYNDLTEIRSPNSSKLNSLSCDGNNLPFSSLNVFRELNYTHLKPQNSVFENIQSTGIIDYSRESEFDDVPTNYKWFYLGGTEISEQYYDITSPGVFTFLIAGEFYCEMTNILFSDLTIRTRSVKIEGGVKSEADIAVLRQIAQNNSDFTHREDWLSESPEWKGVEWGGLLTNTRVQSLNLENTELSSLEVNSLDELKDLNCRRNEIFNIKLPSNLKEVDCSNNRLSLSQLAVTLEIEISNFSNQKPIFKEIESKGVIDFSAEADINGIATSFKWFYSTGEEVVAENYQVDSPGIFTFLMAGEFYCEMTNTLFPDLTLRTANVRILSGNKNSEDIEVLKQIAESNPDFIYREDWLSESPEWKGVEWGGKLSDATVLKLELKNSQLLNLDVSLLDDLISLDCSSSGSHFELSTLTVNGLQKLKKINCRSNSLEVLILDNLPKLESLNCSNNDLEELNLSNLTNLYVAICRNNELNNIEIGNITSLEGLYLDSNNLSFSDLFPLKRISDLSFSNQNRVFENSKSAGEVDYRKESEFESVKTEFEWFKSDETEVKVSELEMSTLGLFTFLIAGDFYCEMTNTLFPNLKITTNQVLVEGGVKNEADILALRQIAEANPEFIYREEWLSETPDWKGVVWSGLLADTRVTELNFEDAKITKLDVSALSELKKLKCYNWFNSPRINELKINGLSNLKELDCRGNKLSDLDFLGLINLETLKCSRNEIQNLDLSSLMNLKELDCSSNDIKELDISKNENLNNLRCDGNKLSFSKLYPLLKVENKNFNNQQALFAEIESTGDVDYSSEAVINETHTIFKWYYSSGKEVVDTDYEIKSPGVFTFKIAGKFYCEMTNALFPDLTLRTANVTVSSENKNLQDTAALKQIAESNPDFIYREDWLSESPKWHGVVWGGELSDIRVISIILNQALLTNLDVSPLHELRELVCSNTSWNKTSSLNSLNVNGLTNLWRLELQGNYLSEIDIKDLINLEKLDCSSSDLKSLDVSGNTKLKEIDVEYNRLPFSQLYPMLKINDYDIESQSLIFETMSSTGIVDFKKEAMFDEKATLFKWYKNTGTELGSEDYEMVEPGLFNLKIAGDFYCVMANELFPNMELRTQMVRIEGKERNEQDLTILKKIAEENSNFTYREDWLSETPEWKGVVWGGELDNTRVIKLDLNRCNLGKLDVRELTDLIELDCRYQHGQLKELNVDGLSKLERLICYGNNLESISLLGLTSLSKLDCSNNNLGKLDISALSKLGDINVSQNNLSFSVLESLLDIENYYCSYQNEIMENIESDGEVDYSSEAIVRNVETQFKWYHSFGVELKSSDYELIEPGIFKIKLAGEFYCEMTNTMFPELTLKTNAVTISSGTNPYILNKHWERKNNFVGGARKGAVGFAIDSYGYLAMGENESLLTDFWRYNSSTDMWSKLEDCPMTARKDAIGFSVDGKGYIGLGTDGSQKLIDFWQYNPDNASWTHITDYPGTNSQLMSWVKHEDKLYFFCGRDVAGKYSREVWVYDPVINEWSQKKNFPGDTRIFAAAYSIGGKIYMGNGQNYEDGSMMTNDLWEYAPETDTWTEQDMILSYTSMSPLYFSIGEKGYYGLSGMRSSDFYELDPKEEDWSSSIFPYSETERNLNDPVIFIIDEKAYFCTGSYKEGFYNETIGSEVIVFNPPAKPVLAPGNLQVSLIEDYKVKLTWKDMSESELSYEVLYSTNGEIFETLKTLEANIEEYTTDDLDPNTTYYFKIRVIGELDDYKESGLLSITTKSEPILAPTELSLDLVDYLKVRINWKDNSRLEESQEILISKDNEYWSSISLESNLETYLTEKLNPNTLYYFKVATVGYNDEVLLSESQSVKTGENPMKPATDLIASISNGLRVELSWKDNSLTETKQEILISKNDLDFDRYAEVDTDIENYTSEDLESATSYFFKIKTIDSQEQYCYSESVEIKTDQVTGIEDVLIENLQIYPNPAIDYVMIKMPGDEIKNIYLLDRAGKVIQVKEARNELKLNIGGLASGVYLIRIVSEEVSVTRRIVVMNR